MSGNPETVSYTYVAPDAPWSHPMLVRSDGAWIPCDLGNQDYEDFLQWLAAGNPAPAGWTGPTNEAAP